ncbi:5-methyltetrahydropteroyltriglutamate--homocysteine methyltransferase [Elysia marginata]|uniref:5-methyltetrahydropteroyltriglutamate--homocysteine S-methyltransferase n=1 Tax=Elysia marginata TaxID=1093978 RepID=A0AAV4FQ49_9GAST|nr:5-methyltetrahydropteroyltriglutamate--homocysteine methyltransferase [Elysia marginata]
MTFELKVIPERYKHLENESPLRRYFAMARGEKGDSNSVTAMKMSKWFDTNYHYIGPEFSSGTTFSDFSNDDIKVLNEIAEAKQYVGGDMSRIRPVLLGPVTYLLSGKVSDDLKDRFALLPALTKSYLALLKRVADTGVEVVQLDEPALVTDIDDKVKQAYRNIYITIAKELPSLKIFLSTYFGDIYENANLVAELPLDTVHLDLIRGGEESIKTIAESGKNISLGLVDGRNIWKTDIKRKIEQLKRIAGTYKNTQFYVGSSCSLLHAPMDLSFETKLHSEVANWLAFSVQKLKEIATITKAYNKGERTVKKELEENKKAIQSRMKSMLVHKAEVKNRVSSVTVDMASRNSEFPIRKKKQKQVLSLPLFPTTTIGSYPQTVEIRKKRAAFRKGDITQEAYISAMKDNIKEVVKFQEDVDIDVLVHGEPERNDMVEYFGENFDGFVSTQNGWVQSYGSRCVKPPIIYGDLTRSKPITIEWISYAQSLTKKVMKAMLTGPITILQWSFVRDDQPRKDTAMQIALTIRDEVTDLENANIKVIQVDEPAIREGLPLRKRDRAEYLDWAVNVFKVSTCGVSDNTQIHTHMCYSEFNEIIASIAALDADVISIEASRSRMQLLDAFKEFEYPNDIGPGVYDIHSPRVPSEEEMIDLMERASKFIPKEQLWINPDCGLKTRSWKEVESSLKFMVKAAKKLREKYSV